jgi:hypothetical protein
MNYLNYLKGIFPDYEITEEVNYKVESGQTTMIIKYLDGTVYKESVFQPIQLMVYTEDVATTKGELEVFAKTYNNAPFQEGFDYVQQIYSTPMLLAAFDPTETQYTQTLVLSGTLIISDNINDIKKVTIDSVTYETIERKLSYVTETDNQRMGSNRVNQTEVSKAMLHFTCTKLHKNDTLATKIKTIREGTLDINTNFTIALEFSTGTTETYTMKLSSAIVSGTNQSLPSLALEFIQ